MKHKIRFLLLLSMVCISFFIPSNKVTTEANTGSQSSITFDGWGDEPKPSPGEEGPQGSGTVIPSDEKPSGSFLKTGEIINTSLSILGLLNVLSAIFLLIAIRSYRKSVKTEGEAE